VQGGANNGSTESAGCVLGGQCIERRARLGSAIHRNGSRDRRKRWRF